MYLLQSLLHSLSYVQQHLDIVRNSLDVYWHVFVQLFLFLLHHHSLTMSV